jgi:transposase-like protein
MSGLDYLIRLVKEAGVFKIKRNKVPVEDKVLSALMHYSGSSLRSVAKWRNFSYEAVRQWYNALRIVLKEPERRVRRIVAVDETKAKIQGKHVYVMFGSKRCVCMQERYLLWIARGKRNSIESWFR